MDVDAPFQDIAAGRRSMAAVVIVEAGGEEEGLYFGFLADE